MKPVNKYSFSFPIYVLDLLPDDAIVIAGGGGRMKSGIPNVCVSFTASLCEFDSRHLRPNTMTN